MRLVRFADEAGAVHTGVDRGDQTAQLVSGDVLSGNFQLRDEVAPIGKRLVPFEPANIFCIGKNYAAHAREGGGEVPTQPVIFMKPTSTLCHPGDPVRLPTCADAAGEVDYECELAVVIGKGGRDIAQANALDHVLGYTCSNDISARRWQKHGGGGQWIRGKSFDTFCPLGPVLVTADEVADPQNLGISMTLNGEVMQQGNTRDMLFPVAELIAFLSRDTTLLPGTVILTGTPEGVGFARNPPVWLKAGDEVVVEIEGVGRLVNPVVDG